ncbi:MAG TPA: alkaline phosphatase family protein [Galbitalea sp.]|nr:alkaline phosphatase family protein [Galbitalea sp.]
MRKILGAAGATLAMTLLLAGCTSIPPSVGPATTPSAPRTTNDASTTTPIKHLVVIYDENISFDHYFGTYPNAANTDGVTFTAAAGTPTPTNLLTGNLLTANPNEFNPFRLSPAEAVTCDQNHSYGPEQQAADDGKNDKAVQFTSGDTCGISGAFSKIGLTMGYFDGNTVTALWNYAQNYALGDHSFSSTFGPSTPGALNLIAGQTHGMKAVDPHTGAVQSSSLFVSSPDAQHVGTATDDADPAFDDCSGNSHTASISLGQMSGQNIGDLLNSKSVSWGWFQGGFTPSAKYNAASGTLAQCNTVHADVAGSKSRDYVPHHDPFQFYASTANPHHLPPSSTAEIGQTDRANHNYDLSDFSAALSAGVLPAVSFLKPAAYQNGHAGNSDPIDEQHFLVKEINAIEASKFWSSTAIIVAYDDSDGWYDQLSSPILNGSNDPLISHELVGDQPACVAAAKSKTGGILDGFKDRCGPGTRQPLLMISPYARTNYIDRTPTEQASILAFIEDNWQTGRLGDGSFDARAGSLDGMFDFTATSGIRLLLNANGTVKLRSRVSVNPAS